MHKEKLITFETAKMAKEKGFDWNYNSSINNILIDELQIEDRHCVIYYSSSSQSLLQKWLREVHGIHINIDFGLEWGYQLISHGCSFIVNEDFIDGKDYNTYEEALEVGLQEALKLIK